MQRTFDFRMPFAMAVSSLVVHETARKVNQSAQSAVKRCTSLRYDTNAIHRSRILAWWWFYHLNTYDGGGSVYGLHLARGQAGMEKIGIWLSGIDGNISDVMWSGHA